MKKVITILAAVLAFTTISQADEFMAQPITQPQPCVKYNLIITILYRSAVIPFDNRESCAMFRKFWLTTHYPNQAVLKRLINDVQCVPVKLDQSYVFEEGE